LPPLEAVVDGLQCIVRPDVPPRTLRYDVDSKAPVAHPYFRAPFILMGNWSQASLARRRARKE